MNGENTKKMFFLSSAQIKKKWNEPESNNCQETNYLI